MMSRLWEYSIQLVDVFGDDEIQKTIAALSYTQTGCKFLASHAFQKLVVLFKENDPRSDWASWIAYVAGILAGRNVKLPPGVSKDLESAIGRLPSERANQARSLVAFHRGILRDDALEAAEPAERLDQLGESSGMVAAIPAH